MTDAAALGRAARLRINYSKPPKYGVIQTAGMFSCILIHFSHHWCLLDLAVALTGRGIMQATLLALAHV